ncbi:hypothetical protein AVEN_36988-1 [Araneus ventricosus]|uniref:Uncharacterized protein n=1 Tax=Araneus ventricosus TaxID=182803 RepID=A0A4Y2W2S0_ARAVE|nr:hypothetical protein AVEN_36988-1 [Araneus ventricosus]
MSYSKASLLIRGAHLIHVDSRDCKLFFLRRENSHRQSSSEKTKCVPLTVNTLLCTGAISAHARLLHSGDANGVTHGRSFECPKRWRETAVQARRRTAHHGAQQGWAVTGSGISSLGTYRGASGTYTSGVPRNGDHHNAKLKVTPA